MNEPLSNIDKEIITDALRGRNVIQELWWSISYKRPPINGHVVKDLINVIASSKGYHESYAASLKDYAKVFNIPVKDPMYVQMKNILWDIHINAVEVHLIADYGRIELFCYATYQPSELLEILTVADRLIPEFCSKLFKRCNEARKEHKITKVIFSDITKDELKSLDQIIFPDSSISFPGVCLRQWADGTDDESASALLGEHLWHRIEEVAKNESGSTLCILPGEEMLMLEDLMKDTVEGSHLLRVVHHVFRQTSIFGEPI